MKTEGKRNKLSALNKSKFDKVIAVYGVNSDAEINQHTPLLSLALG